MKARKMKARKNEHEDCTPPKEHQYTLEVYCHYDGTLERFDLTPEEYEQAKAFVTRLRTAAA
jgi:hypothetical protein